MHSRGKPSKPGFKRYHYPGGNLLASCLCQAKVYPWYRSRTLRPPPGMPSISYPLMMVVRADGAFHGDGHAVAFTSVSAASDYLGAYLGDGLTLRFIHRKDT